MLTKRRLAIALALGWLLIVIVGASLADGVHDDDRLPDSFTPVATVTVP